MLSKRLIGIQGSKVGTPSTTYQHQRIRKILVFKVRIELLFGVGISL